MTTNVFDAVKRMMATDSRWSIRHGNYLIYLDDSGCDKILVRHQRAIMFAGNGRRIQEWKDWIMTDPTDSSKQPKEEGICICMVDMRTGNVVLSVKQKVVNQSGYFAGSGTDYAATCWVQNNDACRSVDTAKLADVCSGGEVKYTDIAGNTHNLYTGSWVTIQMVDDAITKRGLVMNISNGGSTAASFATAANDNPELADIKARISAGELSASAPSEGMYEAWTEKEKAQLNQAFSEMFGWKK
jgi:hypothetical protein